MAQTRLYLSMIPEALVASMLSPEEFGRYLAVGSHKRSSGAAIYFEVDPDFSSDFFDMNIVAERCVAHDDGTPKHSLYLGIYRVLERFKDTDDDTILLDRDWNDEDWQGGSNAPDYVWVVPPGVGGARGPCIAVYQKVMLF